MLIFEACTTASLLAWRRRDPPRPPRPPRPLPRVPDRWRYNGDTDLTHGGTFIDLSTWRDGYCDAVQVTDLGSACGFAGAMLIEHFTVNGVDNPERIRTAVRSCGDFDWCRWAYGTPNPVVIKQCLRHMIAEAMLSYGYRDPDDQWDDWGSSHAEIVQTLADGEVAFDGWDIDKRLDENDDFYSYVVENHLSY